MNSAFALRQAARQGAMTGLTTGLAAGHVQANLVVLRASEAPDFLLFCAANAQACPVLGVSQPGAPHMASLAEDLDIRTDLPGYMVHRAGSAPQALTDITALWRNDSVAVAIGCWFSMEGALLAAGVRLRHVELGLQGPLFKTNRPAKRAGRFAGPLVASMRPFAADAVPTVRRVTQCFRQVHGGPVHEGDPAVLGIADICRPDFGEALEPLAGEVPLYWACGLTAQVALQGAGLDIFITHAPGKMLVTDLLNASLATD